MKYINPQLWDVPHTAAPALSRGLAVLAALNGGTPRTLESLAQTLGFPKASLFRLLKTLQATGMVRKNDSKEYVSLWTLRPVHHPALDQRDRLVARLPQICSISSCTTEWYEPAAEGMLLVEQAHPVNEQRVVAQPGFLRSWNDELDAVARVGYAFSQQAPSLSGAAFSHYAENGRKTPLPLGQARRLIQHTRRCEGARDACFNSNGVRRHAAPLLHDNQLIGVVAIAEGYQFDAKPETDQHLNTLSREIHTL